MIASEPLALLHSWPLFDRDRHFELGTLLSCAVTDVVDPANIGELGLHHAGCWECDLATNELTWSGGVYDLFGLPRGVAVSRREAVGFYSEASRSVMERLRGYAIRNGQGFTIDVDIRPAVRGSSRMRLVAAPVMEAGKAVRLHGLKLAI